MENCGERISKIVPNLLAEATESSGVMSNTIFEWKDIQSILRFARELESDYSRSIEPISNFDQN